MLDWKKSALVALSGLWLLPALAEVQSFRLDNGLEILVKEDHRAPVVTSQVWYKIGASYEPYGLTGVSHMLEHMMFKGTQRFAPGEISKIIARLGGSENAFTGQDYTAYFQTIERSHLKRMFEIEAERMGHLKLNEEEFAKERQVILEERRMRVEDNPNARLFEQFSALAYNTNPYRRPVIGWQQDIEGYRLSDLQHWYESWYAPNNATLVVVGDVNPQEVLAMAKETLGKVPPRQGADRPAGAEVSLKGKKFLQLIDDKTKVPTLLMGYAVPSLLTAKDPADAYALEVLAQILDGGSSARLSKALVRGSQQLSQVGAGYDLYARLSTQFVLSAVPAEGVSLADAEAAIKAQLQQVAREGVSADELQRVKAQVVAQRVFEQDSMFYQAMKLGQAVTIGLALDELEAYEQRISAVTPEQVQDAAQRWLREDRLTVAWLLPADKAGKESM